MTLWVVLTAMIAAAAVLLSGPFIRRLERSRLQSAGDLAVYRDQLKEIESELAQGLIDANQAESASTEIKRKILAAGRTDDALDAPLSRQERNFAVTSVTAIVIFGSIVLYTVVGNPDVPSATPNQASVEQPTPAAAVTATPSKLPATPTQAAVRPQGATPAQPAASGNNSQSRNNNQSQSALPPVEEMVERLQAKLQRNPKDPEGWRMLAWSYFSLDRFADAAGAYSKAIELRPGSADYRSARGEALVRSADGVVTPEARKEFDQALQLDPKDPRARFFTGLAKEQAGDKRSALSDWNNLLAEADPTEAWVPDLKQRVAELRRDLGDTTAAPPRAAPDISVDAMREFLRAEKAKQQAAEASPREPTAEQVRQAESMAPQDRNAMVRGMVEGLAARLDQSPKDAEGWIKLIRSRVVLGESEQAKTSLQRALAIFADGEPERTRIVDAARQLGIEP
ncbi:MAG: c-type cytochrome biogenesis protein CcmI [Bradyrhizobium sp.]|uniref:c-type cytochrome biogenesis protein CcmI n=1 Tax=Bradyrhizobium sp. TaxID=376 RepID=UPI0025C42F57|nr:c-type cytochrome biogenesis protein CcmI [Bradyrhizobium sp.]MBI5261875.1 c-type cytochrome biogenesis protein CcmI [Bradyrhizobium sp.]